MQTNRHANPSLAHPDALFYVEASLPPGMTISEYRRSRPRRSARWERLKQLGGAPRVVAAQSA